MLFLKLSALSFISGEKLKLLEEREQEKEKSTANSSKTDRVMAEVEELKEKMASIELEKVSLLATVSFYPFTRSPDSIQYSITEVIRLFLCLDVDV